MPTYAPHLRLSALGTLGGEGGERFSYGLSLYSEAGTISVGDFEDETAAHWTDVCDSVRDFHARAATKIDVTAMLTQVKIALIDPDGSYNPSGLNPIHRDYAQAGGVGRNAYVLPQNACAVSLGCDLKGPRYRGRFFVPMPVVSAAYDDDYHMSVADAESIRDSANTLIEDINNSPGFDWLGGAVTVCVASGAGFNTKVTNVRVGRVVDTIRSRRRSLSEAYTAPATIG